MTTANWFTVAQMTLFLAVCGFALWAARLIAEAADDSAVAAEHAVKAARDAERTAADIREMRDMLRTWLDEQETLGVPPPAGRVGTDTAETQAVLTPQAIIDRDDIDSAQGPRDSSRPHRGRHARSADPAWTAALRAAASRIGRDKDQQAD